MGSFTTVQWSWYNSLHSTQRCMFIWRKSLQGKMSFMRLNSNKTRMQRYRLGGIWSRGCVWFLAFALLLTSCKTPALGPVRGLLHMDTKALSKPNALIWKCTKKPIFRNMPFIGLCYWNETIPNTNRILCKLKQWYEVKFCFACMRDQNWVSS